MAYQNLKGSELQAILDHAGSFSRFKEMLGIDELTFQRLRIHYNLTMHKLGEMPLAFIASEVTRIGSVELFCIVYRCKPSELRKKLAGVAHLRELIAPVGSKTGIGRAGELFFKSIRGQEILEDCLITRGHTHPFDFIDRTYGLVNVKTAQRRRFKAKSRASNPNYWDFNLSGVKDCDFIALVPLNPKGEPYMVIMADCKVLVKMNIDHFVVTGKTIRPASPHMSYMDGVYRLMFSGYFDGTTSEVVQPVQQALP